MDLLVAAEPQIKRVDDALRAVELERQTKSFNAMAGKFLDDPKLKAQLDDMRADHLADRMKQYDEFNTVEGNEVLDRALQSLSWFGPRPPPPRLVHRRLRPLRRPNPPRRRLPLRPGMFKLVAHTAFRFSEEVRKWAWPEINGDARDEVEALEREVKIRAVGDSLELY